MEGAHRSSTSLKGEPARAAPFLTLRYVLTSVYAPVSLSFAHRGLGITSEFCQVFPQRWGFPHKIPLRACFLTSSSTNL